MSVAQLTAQELGCFVAVCHKHLKAGPIDKLAGLACLASHGNAGAFSAQYCEPMEPASAEDYRCPKRIDDLREIINGLVIACRKAYRELYSQQKHLDPDRDPPIVYDRSRAAMDILAAAIEKQGLKP